jgi:hypothetical protein
MPWYVVSYDLRGNESQEAYERIGNALRTATDWCKPLLSHWIVESPLTASQIIERLFSVGAIDDDDGPIVLETTMRGHFRRIQSPAVEWLRERVVAF